MVKFCPECGTKLNGPMKFCPECGFDLRKLNAPEPASEPAPEPAEAAEAEPEQMAAAEPEETVLGGSDEPERGSTTSARPRASHTMTFVFPSPAAP